ncbi:MAG: thiolase family protein [Actinobacteria bacterium]|nr:thiolase family protein [Actinomycetota bacterium]MCL6095722.1 thiolase family protein [Actinomycetota bacterium]
MNIQSRIAILGGAQSMLGAHRDDVRLEELVFEAAEAALDDAGVKRSELDTVVLAGSDQMDGRSISSMVTACPAGAYLKDEIRTTIEGSFAAVLACMRILSGEFETALAVTWTKTSESPYDLVSSLSYDPFYQRPIGLSDVIDAAAAVSTYTGSKSTLADAACSVVVKNRSNGEVNPRAFLRYPMARETIDDSPYVAYPIRRAEIPQACDGAVAVLFGSAQRAKAIDHQPVWVDGVGWATGEYGIGVDPPVHMRALRAAAARAYAMAGVVDPSREFNFAEIFDGTPYHEIFAYEALGLTPDGLGPAFILDGASERHGALPVNPSGGLQATNLRFASGMSRILEAYLQLSGRAGPVQVASPRQGIAHGATTYPAQSHAIFVMRNY